MSVVSTTADSGVGSFRQAIIDSNGNLTDITFTTTGTLTLVTGLPSYTGGYDIIGPGYVNFIVNCNDVAETNVMSLFGSCNISGLRWTRWGYTDYNSRLFALDGVVAGDYTFDLCKFDDSDATNTATNAFGIYAAYPVTLVMTNCVIDAVDAPFNNAAFLACPSIESVYDVTLTGNTVTNSTIFLWGSMLILNFNNNTITDGVTGKVNGLAFTKTHTGVLGGTSFSFVGNTFTNLTTEGAGGALYLLTCKDVTVTNNVFENCKSSTSNGGAISFHYCAGETKVEHNEFNNCYAYSYGGACYTLFTSDLTNAYYIGNTYNSNTGQNGAGAVYLQGVGGSGGMTFVQETYYNNESVNGTGGLRIHRTTATYPADIINCTFTKNIGNNGVGLYNTNGVVNLVNCVFDENYFKSGGPASDLERTTATASYTGNNNLIGYQSNAGFTDGVDGNKIGTGYTFGIRPLADNGGLVKTCKILSHSDAYNSGENNPGNHRHTVTKVAGADKNGSGSVIFDGDGDCLTVPDDADFANTVRTMELDVIFDVDETAVFYSHCDSASVRWMFYYQDNALVFIVNNIKVIGDAWTPVVGTSYRLCVEVNGTAVQFYVDGVDKGSGTLGSSISNHINLVYVGARNHGDGISLELDGSMSNLMDSKVIRHGSAYTPSNDDYTVDANTLFNPSFYGAVGSDVLDLAKDDTSITYLDYDARGSGFPRIVFGITDMGAYELSILIKASVRGIWF